MKKKFFALLLAFVVVFTAGAFVACGDGREQLVVATNAEFAPFEYKEGNKFTGIDIEIGKLIADELDMELVIVNMDFESVVTSVGKNNIDIAMAGLTVSDTRKESVDFTRSYYEASQVVIVKIDDTTFDGCETAEDVENVLRGLTGKKTGYQNGTTGEYYVKGDEDLGFDGYSNIAKNGYANGALAVTDMTNGNIDLVVIDEMPARAIVKRNPNAKIIDIKLTEEEYAFGVDKNQPELKNSINTILDTIMADGTLEAISEKYFNDDLKNTRVEVAAGTVRNSK